MAYFLTRIELHKADEPFYETLHSKMAEQGFLRVIQGDDKVIYQLPTAEYCKVTNDVFDKVYLDANNAAKSVGKKYMIVVTQVQYMRWDHLSPAK